MPGIGLGDTLVEPRKLTQFLKEYKKFAELNGMNPNPFDKRHAYDYLSWWLEGGKFPTEQGGHFDSKYKSPWHPNRFPDETLQNGMVLDSISGAMIPRTKARFIEGLYSNLYLE